MNRAERRAMKAQGLAVPLAKASNNPVAMGLTYNAPMGAWDINIDVGNFPTERAAREAADFIAKLFQKELGVDFSGTPTAGSA
jgi:hypothetical protein